MVDQIIQVHQMPDETLRKSHDALADRVLKNFEREQSNERDRTLGENLSINIRLGFLAAAFGGVISVVIIFVSLRSDVIQMLSQTQLMQRTIDDQQKQIQLVQLTMQQFKDRLDLVKIICPGVP